MDIYTYIICRERERARVRARERENALDRERERERGSLGKGEGEGERGREGERERPTTRFLRSESARQGTISGSLESSLPGPNHVRSRRQASTLRDSVRVRPTGTRPVPP